MLKQANLSFSVAAQSFGDDVTSIQFSTQDKNTAKLIFTIKEGKQPLDLTDVEGKVDLVMGDKSVFDDNIATVTAPLDGKLEYTITPEQIRHPGRARGELQLIGKDGQSIGGFRFNFTVKKALVDEYAGPVKEYYVQDLEAIKAEIQKTADSIKDLDVVRIDTKLNELEEQIGEGVGVDEQARQEIEGLTAQLADTVKENKTAGGRSFSGSLISFISDDGHPADMTHMLPPFERQGVPFCTAVVPYRVGTSASITIEQMKLLESKGHEIMSHSYSHANLAQITVEELENEVKNSKEYLLSHGLKVKNFAVPYGSYNNNVKLAMQRYFRSGRISEGYFNKKPLETFELKTLWITSDSTVDKASGFAKNSLDHYKWYIDRAHAENSWLIISTHSWEIKEWKYERLLEDIIIYAKSKTSVVTINEALDKLDNLTESSLFSKKSPYDPHFVVSSDGVVESDLMFYKKVDPSKVTLQTPITDFPPQAVSVCNILTANATGFPENKAGLLKTHRFFRAGTDGTDGGYSYQEYKIHNSDNRYVRAIKTDGTWGEFFLDTYRDNKIINNTSLNNTTPPNALKGNTIEYRTCNLSEATTLGMPENKAGTLFAYSFKHWSNDPVFYFQEYCLRGSSVRYVRHATSATAWSSWVNPNGPENEKTLLRARGTFTGETPPSEFPKGKIIKTSVAANTTGMPTTTSGVLTIDTTGLVTASATDWGYVTQEYTKYATTEKWVRTATSDSAWTSWSKINMI